MTVLAGARKASAPASDVVLDACFRCGELTVPTVIARDLERDATVGGYVCARCGASWFTSYLLSAEELAHVLAARRASGRA
ncbi:MAG TPA: hypothetical protein VFC31_13090 [Candidatus Limnocylindria bacterium]|nr:hypothetical protein [Candidatus Limnocylindria bacterium]